MRFSLVRVKRQESSSGRTEGNSAFSIGLAAAGVELRG